MEEVSAIILAAGEGKRMNSKKSKVLHEICGKPIVEWVYDAVQQSGINNSVLVVGHKAEQVMTYMEGKTQFALQKQQLGTGHAVMKTESFIKTQKKYVIILNGDTPLISSNTIKEALDYHIKNDNAATMLTTEINDARGYGRVLRNCEGDVIKIVEHKDATKEEKLIKEINSGIYCFTVEHLFDALAKISNKNSQQEYYLTDTIEILIKQSLKVGAIKISDSSELLGINNRIQLAEIESIMRRKIIKRHMENGVTFINAENTYISSDAIIGMDTIIYHNCIIEGKSKIGEDCIIGPDSRIVNSIIGTNVEVQNSVIIDSQVDNGTQVGPFAYLRPNSLIGKNVKIGDFVEIKNAIIKDDTKISHLAYIGDSEVGKNVNIGCGCITVNYDGENKQKTFIGDNAFIGCNSNLISPVKINKDSYIAAGSTITEEVPKGALAIARERQVIKEGWVQRRGQKK